MSKHFSTCLLVLIFLLNRCLSIPISISSLLNPASPDDDAPPPSDTRKSPSPQGHNAQHALNPGRSSSSSQGHDAAPELSTQRRAKRKRRSRARAPALESSTQLYDHRGRKIYNCKFCGPTTFHDVGHHEKTNKHKNNLLKAGCPERPPSGIEIPCDYPECKETRKNAQSMSRHKNRAHGGPGPY